MAVGEYDDEEFAVGPPPAPEDRVWRHPSEFAADRRRTQRRVQRRIWRVRLLSALTGAVVVGAVWHLSDPGAEIRVVTQQVASVPVESFAPRVSSADAWADEVAASARPAVAIVASADGTQPLAGAVAVHGEGYLLTSARAIGDATDVVVHTGDGHTMAATVLGHDHDTDLSVIRADREIAPAPVAARPAERGDVVAVVEPGGPAHRRVVTDAAASSTAVDGDQLIGLLGLDGERGMLPAGSPVLDESGAVVAIVTATDPDAAVTAIPIEVANTIAGSIISEGGVRRAWLGVSAGTSPGAVGVEITAVTIGSPADEAGVAVADHILEIGDREVHSPASIVAALRTHQPGESVSVTVQRGGETMRLDVVLGEDGA